MEIPQAIQQYPGSIFRSENFIYSPPSEKEILSPSRDTSFFISHCGLFALILPYFAIILPFYFPFSHFLSPSFLFLLHFPPFSLPFHIFSPKWHRLIFPPPQGRGIFQYIHPWQYQQFIQRNSYQDNHRWALLLCSVAAYFESTTKYYTVLILKVIVLLITQEH